jgi:hypothetical protein
LFKILHFQRNFRQLNKINEKFNKIGRLKPGKAGGGAGGRFSIGEIKLEKNIIFTNADPWHF